MHKIQRITQKKQIIFKFLYYSYIEQINTLKKMEYLYIVPIALCIINGIFKNLRFFIFPKIYKQEGFDKLIEYEKQSKKINITLFPKRNVNDS